MANHRTSIAWSAAWLLCAAGVAFSGCRSLQCEKASDQSLAAARQLSLQGLDAQQQGRWEQAETLFAAAVEQCPSDERARCGYAQALWQRGEHDQAVAHMEQAVRLSGNDPERLVQLGEMYLSRGELHPAEQQADRAIAANPQLAGAWALRGKSLQAEGRRREALAHFYRALSYQPHLPEVQLAIAEIYSQDRRPQRALATLQALAAAYPPGNAPVEVLVREGLVLRDLGRHGDAAKALASAIQRGNASAELFCELAQTQILAGDAIAARAALAAALDRDPAHARSLALRRELAPRDEVVAAMAPEQSMVH